MFAKAIDTLQATKALLASGQAGVTTNLLVNGSNKTRW